MAEDPFENLRLLLMQDVLPVGLAMVERARQGGANKLVEAFKDSKDPLQDLRVEGETAARSLRDRLDQVSPGLGNPVVSVKVAVDEEVSNNHEIEDEESLLAILCRIEGRLEELEAYIEAQNVDSVASSDRSI